MRRRYYFVLLAVAAIAACSARGGPGVSITQAPAGGQAVQPHVVKTAAPTLYAADAAGNAVDEFDANVPGDVAPTNSIVGPDTQLGSPNGVAVGSDGSVYVADDAGSGSVTVYGPGATGDAAPTRTITCGGIDQPAGVALDAAGDLFVANTGGNSISVFAPTDNGCVSGNRIISGRYTCLIRPRDVDLSPDGHIYVASSSSVLVFRPGATGDSTPLQHITGTLTELLPAVEGVDLDSGGDIIVSSAATYAPGRITIYTGSATGDVAPFVKIGGTLTTLGALRHIEVDLTGQIWVSNGAAVDVFAAGASGDVAPAAVFSGSLTGLLEPLGIDLVPSGL